MTLQDRCVTTIPRVGRMSHHRPTSHTHQAFRRKLTHANGVWRKPTGGVRAIAITDHGKATAYRMARGRRAAGMIVIRWLRVRHRRAEHLVGSRPRATE